MMLRRTVVAGALMALALVGCKRGDAKESGGKGSARAGAAVGGQGVMLAEGPAEDLRVTEDGQFATYLQKTHKPTVEGIPPQMRLGTLYVVPVTGGAPRKLGDGVTNVPGGLLFTPDSKHVLYLTGYNLANQSGALHVLALSEPTAEPQKLGGAVSYFLPSPDGSKLAFVDGGVLKLGALPAGPFQTVAGEVSTAGFSPDGSMLFIKRRLAAAGGLLAIPVAGEPGKQAEPRKLADQVGDYVLSPDSKRVAYQVRSTAVPGTYDLYVAELPELKSRQVATGTSAFAFSPDSQWLARTEGSKPELLGDLFVGPASGEPGRKVGERVKEPSFSPDSKALGFLAKYDLPAGAGLMGVVTLPDGEPKLVGSRVPNFVWGKDGKHVAFLSRFLKPIYSVDLMLYQVGAEKAAEGPPGRLRLRLHPGGQGAHLPLELHPRGPRVRLQGPGPAPGRAGPAADVDAGHLQLQAVRGRQPGAGHLGADGLGRLRRGRVRREDAGAEDARPGRAGAGVLRGPGGLAGGVRAEGLERRRVRGSREAVRSLRAARRRLRWSRP